MQFLPTFFRYASMTSAARMETVSNRGTVRAKARAAEDLELFTKEELQTSETSRILLLACRLTGRATLIKCHWPIDNEKRAQYVAAARMLIVRHPSIGTDVAVDRFLAIYKIVNGGILQAREILEPTVELSS